MLSHSTKTVAAIFHLNCLSFHNQTTIRSFWSHPVLACFLLFSSKVSSPMLFLSSSKNSKFFSSTLLTDYSQICKAKLLEIVLKWTLVCSKLTIFRKQFDYKDKPTNLQLIMEIQVTLKNYWIMKMESGTDLKMIMLPSFEIPLVASVLFLRNLV